MPRVIVITGASDGIGAELARLRAAWMKLLAPSLVDRAALRALRQEP